MRRAGAAGSGMNVQRGSVLAPGEGQVFSEGISSPPRSQGFPEREALGWVSPRLWSVHTDGFLPPAQTQRGKGM